MGRDEGQGTWGHYNAHVGSGGAATADCQPVVTLSLIFQPETETQIQTFVNDYINRSMGKDGTHGHCFGTLDPAHNLLVSILRRWHSCVPDIG